MLTPRKSVRVMFGGDVMLGRTVKEYIVRYGPRYPLGPVAESMRSADLCIVNLECAITSATEWWRGERKAFYFGAPPQAIHTLTDAGIDAVSLANNHVLDFNPEGLRQTLDCLRRASIKWTGAGNKLREALQPAIMESHGLRFGMAAFCDHQRDFSAAEDRPGIAYVALDDEAAALDVFRQALDLLRQQGVHWPVLSLHWGPNMVVRPSGRHRRLAHAAIDMGWKILFGHSAHVFHGLEIYRACPIIYAAGDLVDDYYVDPQFRNDHQLLLEIEVGRDAVQGIRFLPVLISDCRANMATGSSREYIVKQFSALCRELGSEVDAEEMRIRLGT
ncbi:MAG: CapA family protein [Burkholderiaceae bacterium]